MCEMWCIKMPDVNRRKFLKKVGIATGATAFGVGNAQARSPDESKTPFNTSFDPRDKKEVGKFVAETFQWSEKVSQQTVTTADAQQSISAQRSQVVEELTDEQLEAVGEIMKDVKFVAKRPSENDVREVSSDGVTISSCNDYDDNVKGYVYVPYVGNTLLAFNFVHNVGWCVSGDEVINVNPTAVGNAKGYVLVNWDYQGISDSSLTYHPDNYYAISYLKGKYNRCIVGKSGLTCVATDYGWVEIAVYNDRSGRTLDKGVDG